MPFKTLGKTCEYIRSIMPAERDACLRAITDYADSNFIPVLLPETAALLKQIVMLKNPKNILEIGMAIGYSGHIMLKAAESAHLYTIEVLESSIEKAKEFFKSSGLESRVTIYEGDASEIVPLISGSYDFIFLDGPKARYLDYLPFLKRALNAGGILLCDNVLYNGMVSGENPDVKKQGGLVKRLDMFLRALMADGDFITSVIPVGDGVSISIKNR